MCENFAVSHCILTVFFSGPDNLFPSDGHVIFLASRDVYFLYTGNVAGTDGGTHLGVRLVFTEVVEVSVLALLLVLHPGHAVRCVVLGPW